MTETRFEGSGPVARYWLANCEGFAVRGRPRGIVERLIRGGDDPHATAWIVVRTRARRRRTIPAGAVGLVDPGERTLFLAQRPRRRPPLPPVVPAVRATRAAVEPRARDAAVAAFGHGRAVAVRLAPVVALAATLLRVAASALVGSFVHLGAEALATVALIRRYPNPYVPAKRWASSLTRRAAGRPTTFR